MTHSLTAVLLLALCLPTWAASPSDSLLFEDYFGRSVRVPDVVRRIVPLYWGEAEILVALGAKQLLVGVGFLREPPSTLLDTFMPEIVNIPRVGRGVGLNIERLISLRPDVVLAEGDRDTVERLAAMGFSTIASFPRRYDDLFIEIRMISRLAGVPGRGDSLANMLQGVLEDVRARVGVVNEGSRPRIYYVWSDILTTVNDLPQGEVFRIAGGRNVAEGRAGAHNLTVSLETLYRWDPDVIILRDRSPLTVQDVLHDARLQRLRAVLGHRVFKEHAGWAEYRIESVFGVAEKAIWLNPTVMSLRELRDRYAGMIRMLQRFDAAALQDEH